MKVVYVAGPFRADTPWGVEQNIRRAEAFALELWRTGKFAVICPHTNTRFFDKAAPDDVFLQGDLAILKRCDAVVLIPGWGRSKGSNAEVVAAWSAGIPVFEEISALIEWANS